MARSGIVRTGWRSAGEHDEVYAARVQDTIRTLLQDTTTWAVVGLSPNPARDSNRIATLLQSKGKRVIAANPNVDEVLGARAYATLHELPAGTAVDVVDILRRADLAGAHVDVCRWSLRPSASTCRSSPRKRSPAAPDRRDARRDGASWVIAAVRCGRRPRGARP